MCLGLVRHLIGSLTTDQAPQSIGKRSKHKSDSHVKSPLSFHLLLFKAVFLNYNFCLLHVLISQSPKVADHCRTYALSDPKEPLFQATCDHVHSDVCERYATLVLTLNNIKEGLVVQSQNMTSNTKEELVFCIKNAKTAILAWKPHLLPPVNKDGTRVQPLEVIDESSVLIVQDWAMRYLPQKYRKSQTD